MKDWDVERPVPTKNDHREYKYHMECTSCMVKWRHWNTSDKCWVCKRRVGKV